MKSEEAKHVMNQGASKKTRAMIDALLAWFATNKRPLPWRATRDPYRIWISEVMLQQTRVATVIPYYERFLETFPNVGALAGAKDDALMKAWEGLGYYARVRHLREAAQTIVTRQGGRLPASRDELLRLKGFGAYTAASVASLAFNQDCAAVDGNVMRVLSRLFAIESDVRRSAAKREFQRLADALVPRGRAGPFNEAMMELGATVCKPKNPACEACPVRRHCRAYRDGRTTELPWRSAKPDIPHRQIAVGVVHKNGKVLIALRPAVGLLGNLWEFPGGKRSRNESLAECCRREILEETGLDVETGARFCVVRHSYSHFRVTLHAFHCRYRHGRVSPRSSQKVRWVRIDELDRYAFPRANKKILEDLLRSPDFVAADRV